MLRSSRSSRRKVGSLPRSGWRSASWSRYRVPPSPELSLQQWCSAEPLWSLLGGNSMPGGAAVVAVAVVPVKLAVEMGVVPTGKVVVGASSRDDVVVGPGNVAKEDVVVRRGKVVVMGPCNAVVVGNTAVDGNAVVVGPAPPVLATPPLLATPSWLATLSLLAPTISRWLAQAIWLLW